MGECFFWYWPCPDSHKQKAVKRLCVCVCVCVRACNIIQANIRDGACDIETVPYSEIKRSLSMHVA